MEDGFIIRGVHRESSVSHKEAPGSMVMRNQSFIGGATQPAPVYRPRARPVHITQESKDNKQMAETRRQQGIKQFRVTAQLAKMAAHTRMAKGGMGATVANQIVAKKWKEIGNMLKHTAGGVSKMMEIVDKEKKGYASAAQEALRLAAVGVLGVKLTVRSEKELQHLSYLNQGDASLYTPEAMSARLAIKSTEEFRAAVRGWWQWLPLCTMPPEDRLTIDERLMPKEMRGMTKPVYCAMAAIIQRALLPRFGVKPNINYEPEEDWHFDCRGKRFLLFPQLLGALFELADMWCPTIEVDDYVTIVKELLEQVKTLEGRHGLFSKLLRKYQRKYGARAEHQLPISGGYVVEYDGKEGKARTGVAVDDTPHLSASGDAVTKAAALAAAAAQRDEADAMMQALADEDDGDDHAAATNWWAKVVERNRKFLAAKAARDRALAEVAAAAAAADAAEAEAAEAEGRRGSQGQHPDAFGSLYESRDPTVDGGTDAGSINSIWQNFPVPALPAELDKDSDSRAASPVAVNRMGKGVKGQLNPGEGPPPILATLREAVTDALGEVGAGAEGAMRADGTIAVQQVGSGTLAGLIKVLVDMKRMNTRHIRLLMTDFTGPRPAPVQAFPPAQRVGSTGLRRHGLAAGLAAASAPGLGRSRSRAGSMAAMANPSQRAALFAAMEGAEGAGEDPSASSVGVGASQATLGSLDSSALAASSSLGPGGSVLLSAEPSAAPGAGKPGPGPPSLGGEPSDLLVEGGGSGAGGLGTEEGGNGEEGGEDGGGEEGEGEGVQQGELLLDPVTLAAMRAALQEADLGGAALPDLIAPHGLGLTEDVPPEILTKVADILAAAGFESKTIVSFLFPPEEALEAASGSRLSDVQLNAMKHALDKAGMAEQIDLVRTWAADIRTIQTMSATLEAAGFTPLEVHRFIAPAASTALIDALHRGGLTPAAAAGLLRADGTLSLAMSGPDLAEAAEAMAMAGFTAQQMVHAMGADAAAVPPLEPALLQSVRDALLSEGFSEDELTGAVLVGDGSALQDGVGAVTLARLVASLVRAGMGVDLIRRFLRYDVVRGAAQPLPVTTLSAMNNAIEQAGLNGSPNRFIIPEAGVVPMLPDFSGVAPEAGAGIVAQVGSTLVEAMFKPSQIRAFLMPDVSRANSYAPGSGIPGQTGQPGPPYGVPVPPGLNLAAQGGGAGGLGLQAGGKAHPGWAANVAGVAGSFAGSPLVQSQSGGIGWAGPPGPAPPALPRRHHLTARDIVVFRTVLMAAGFTAQDLMDLIRPDGRGLDPDADSDLACRAVAALAAAGFRGHEIQLYIALRDPAPALTPAEAAAARAALSQAGFPSGQLQGLIRYDGLGLASDPEPDPLAMSQIAVVLASAGFPTFHIAQYLAPALPLIPVDVAERGRYYQIWHTGGEDGHVSRAVSTAPTTAPWEVTDEDGLLDSDEEEAEDAAEMEERREIEAGIFSSPGEELGSAQVEIIAHPEAATEPGAEGEGGEPEPERDHGPHRYRGGRARSDSGEAQAHAGPGQAQAGPDGGEGEGAHHGAAEGGEEEAEPKSALKTGGKGDGKSRPVTKGGIKFAEEVPVPSASVEASKAAAAAAAAALMARAVEKETSPLGRLVLDDETLGAMRFAVPKRCKGLTFKQMRQLGPHLGDTWNSAVTTITGTAPPAGAAAAVGAVAAAAAAAAGPAGPASGPGPNTAVLPVATASAAGINISAGGAGGGGSVTAGSNPGTPSAGAHMLGSGLAPSAPPPAPVRPWLPSDHQVTQRITRGLAYEGFSPAQIRRFFLQPVVAAAQDALDAGQVDPEEAAEAAAGVDVFDHITPSLLALIRALLKASGFTDAHLESLFASDRRRLDPDWDSESCAMLVAAMAAAGWPAHLIRIQLTTGPPVPALTPDTLGSINEALLDCGFSRRQLALVLRRDHSGPGPVVDATTLAQMAAALSQAGFSTGQLCQFLGPSPVTNSAAAAAAPPATAGSRGLLTPLLTAIAASAAAATASPTGMSLPAMNPTSKPLTAATAAAALAAATAATGAPQPFNPAGGSAAATAASALGLTVLLSAMALVPEALDSRGVMDVRNVAASCGISSRALADMIRPDGRGMTPHADPRVVERVGQHMANQGFTPAQVRYFLLPHGGSEYGKFDTTTAAAVRATLLAAGFGHAELKALLGPANNTNFGNVVLQTASPLQLATVCFALAASGATADQIRHFLRPPPSVTPHNDAAAALPPPVAGAVREALLAAGYGRDVMARMIKRDGTGLRADVGPLRLAQVVAAMSVANFPASTIRMFCRPMGGVSPALAHSLRAALERAPGFSRERVKKVFSPEGNELAEDIDAVTLAEVAAALHDAGYSSDVIRQLMAIPGLPLPQPAPPASSLPPPSESAFSEPPMRGENSTGSDGGAAALAASLQLPDGLGSGLGSGPNTGRDVSPSRLRAVSLANSQPPAGTQSDPGTGGRGDGQSPKRERGGARAAPAPAPPPVSLLPPAKLASMKEAFFSHQASIRSRASSVLSGAGGSGALPSLDFAVAQDPAMVAIALAQAAFTTDDIRAFLSTDPRLLAGSGGGAVSLPAAAAAASGGSYGAAALAGREGAGPEGGVSGGGLPRGRNSSTGLAGGSSGGAGPQGGASLPGTGRISDPGYSRGTRQAPVQSRLSKATSIPNLSGAESEASEAEASAASSPSAQDPVQQLLSGIPPIGSGSARHPAPAATAAASGGPAGAAGPGPGPAPTDAGLGGGSQTASTTSVGATDGVAGSASGAGSGGAAASEPSGGGVGAAAEQGPASSARPGSAGQLAPLQARPQVPGATEAAAGAGAQQAAAPSGGGAGPQASGPSGSGPAPMLPPPLAVPPAQAAAAAAAAASTAAGQQPQPPQQQPLANGQPPVAGGAYVPGGGGQLAQVAQPPGRAAAAAVAVAGGVPPPQAPAQQQQQPRRPPQHDFHYAAPPAHAAAAAAGSRPSSSPAAGAPAAAAAAAPPASAGQLLRWLTGRSRPAAAAPDGVPAGLEDQLAGYLHSTLLRLVGPEALAPAATAAAVAVPAPAPPPPPQGPSAGAQQPAQPSPHPLQQPHQPQPQPQQSQPQQPQAGPSQPPLAPQPLPPQPLQPPLVRLLSRMLGATLRKSRNADRSAPHQAWPAPAPAPAPAPEQGPAAVAAAAEAPAAAGATVAAAPARATSAGSAGAAPVAAAPPPPPPPMTQAQQAAATQAVASVLSALLHRTPGGAAPGGGLDPEAAAPSVLRLAVVAAARAGALAEADWMLEAIPPPPPPAHPYQAQPLQAQTLQAQTQTYRSTGTQSYAVPQPYYAATQPYTSYAPPQPLYPEASGMTGGSAAARRSMVTTGPPESGILRPLPAGYARGFGDQGVTRRLPPPMTQSAGGSLLDATANRWGHVGGGGPYGNPYAAAVPNPYSVASYGNGSGTNSPTSIGLPAGGLQYKSMPARANPSYAAAKAGSPRETLPPWPLQRAFLPPTNSAAHNPLGPEGSSGRLGAPDSPSAPGSPALGRNAPDSPASRSGVGAGAGGVVLPPAARGGPGRPASPSAGGAPRPASAGAADAEAPDAGSSRLPALPPLLTRSGSTGRILDDALASPTASPRGGRGPGADGPRPRPSTGGAATPGSPAAASSPAPEPPPARLQPLALPGGAGGGGLLSPSNLAAAMEAAGAGPGGPWSGGEALFARLLAELLRWYEAPAGDAWSASAQAPPPGWIAAQRARLSAQLARLGPEPPEPRPPPPPPPHAAAPSLPPAVAAPGPEPGEPGPTFLITQAPVDET
ncbi:hypothetical protein HYH03_015277 [Edaphochlamys debaryana]|uniref:Uncharacterized protein n=1 Tax=Edaphochlamys debaryana TaxID=47281 RepID=A0A836BR45_9CHLO|nr:hypothetical protein HYH03_015277 [Edaphochlamys debaryana]|eukprot:KAG2486071.1 hypothetical protein HYH03_015277 [Edaphochlamys debaryana]